ncbi:hypothetical protein [Novipirellula caenicola]|uniref:Hemerythrin-like domain-containing protein n=1 Tax=Novipirellula caenicola TaxID=1536901 RepID=A0ABP9W0K6_9BACT
MVDANRINIERLHEIHAKVHQLREIHEALGEECVELLGVGDDSQKIDLARSIVDHLENPEVVILQLRGMP